MRAALLDDYGKPLDIREVDTPEPGPGEVLVRIGGSGACHSDLHVIDADMPMLPSLPWILGHENAGWVEALGPGATGFDTGEPVAVYGGWGCGHCRFCASGDEQVCDVMKWSGIGRPGGYAEFLVVPSTRHLAPIGDLEPAKAAPLTDAALTPYRAVKRSLPYLPSMTGGEGAQAVFDFVGIDATLSMSASSVGRQGLVSVIGLGGGMLPFSFMGIASEATVIGSAWGSRNDLAEVISLAQKGELADTSESYPLDEINSVFSRLRDGQIDGRAVLVP